MTKLREMKASGVDIDSVMKKEARETLYKKEVEKMLSNGQGVRPAGGPCIVYFQGKLRLRKAIQPV